MGLIAAGEKVAVFIDGQFLIRGLNVTCPSKLFDYASVASNLAAPGKLTRVGYYTAPPPGYLPEEIRTQHNARIERLRGLPFFDVHLGIIQQKTRTVVPIGETAPIQAKYWHQKGVDVRLVIDMMGSAYRNLYDTAILVSGDSDFVEMVRVVKEAHKHVINATSPRSGNYHPSVKLQRACDGHILMNAAFLAPCELRGYSSKPARLAAPLSSE